jgi:hypothetical protein
LSGACARQADLANERLSRSRPTDAVVFRACAVRAEKTMLDELMRLASALRGLRSADW